MVKCSKAEVRRLKTALRWKMPPEQRQRIQMVLLRESGLAQPAIAQAMGVSLSTVNRAHMAYDHGGKHTLTQDEASRFNLRQEPGYQGFSLANNLHWRPFPMTLAFAKANLRKAPAIRSEAKAPS